MSATPLNNISILALQIVILMLATLPISQCSALVVLTGCIEYSDRICRKCSLETHLGTDGFCYENIIGCEQYGGVGEICMECDSRISLKSGDTCQLFNNQTSSQFERCNYGDSDTVDELFLAVPYSEVNPHPAFQLADKAARIQYQGLISPVRNPVFSVFHFRNRKATTYSFKIFYKSTAGGLFLFTADVPALSTALSPIETVTILSLGRILPEQVIEHCINYDECSVSCTLCEIGFHLEGGACFKNSGGCTLYKQNICLECIGSSVLIENRCISSCSFMADGLSVLYYGNSLSENKVSTVSTLQEFTKVSLSMFYDASKAKGTEANQSDVKEDK